MGLDQDAGLFLIDLTQFLPGGNGFADASASGRESAMRVQLLQTPQKSGRPSLTGCCRQAMVCASMMASVYLPAPRGPARMSAGGIVPPAIASRKWRTVAAFPAN